MESSISLSVPPLPLLPLPPPPPPSYPRPFIPFFLKCHIRLPIDSEGVPVIMACTHGGASIAVRCWKRSGSLVCRRDSNRQHSPTIPCITINVKHNRIKWCICWQLHFRAYTCIVSYVSRCHHFRESWQLQYLRMGGYAVKMDEVSVKR